MNRIQTITQTLCVVLVLLVGSSTCLAQKGIPETAAGARLAQMLEALDVEGEKLDDFPEERL